LRGGLVAGGLVGGPPRKADPTGDPREEINAECAEKRNPRAHVQQRPVGHPAVGNPVLAVLAYYKLARESGTEVL
jgi:hypothetical protein